jgi:exodeoxyribonuclease-3
MKLVSWNIRHGGGSSARAASIAQTLIAYDADVLVVTEFQIGRPGTALCGRLKQTGYQFSHPPSEEGKNTVLVASRRPIQAERPFDLGAADLRHLWLVETGGLRIVGVYMPVGTPKLPYWEAVIRGTSSSSPQDLFLGDFNTGNNNLDKDPGGTPFIGPEFMDKIAAAGFADLWRDRNPEHREYTWFSSRGKNGFRLDHAFGSSRLSASLTNCYYDHEPRLIGLSDHSAMVVELDGFNAALAPEAIGCIYALADPGCPGVVKIGKDQKWPQHLRQAQAHTPRGMVELGRWAVAGDRGDLARSERNALALFAGGPSCPGREWVRASSSEVIEALRSLFGEPEPPTDVVALRPFDDWRDYGSRPIRRHLDGYGLARRMGLDG